MYVTVGIQLLGFVDLIYGIRAKREIIAATERGKKKTDLVEDLAARDVLLFNVATLSKTWRETSGNFFSDFSNIFEFERNGMVGKKRGFFAVFTNELYKGEYTGENIR